MKKTVLFLLSYSLSVLFGGVFGYFRSGSIASLTCGLSFGVLLLVSCAFIEKNKFYGYWMALFLGVLLEGIFIYRFAKTLNFMPAGFLSFFTLAIIIVLALKINKQLKIYH